MGELRIKPVDPEPTPDVEPESGLPVPETKIEHYLKKIAENGSLPSSKEASAGDVLSLDEDKKPTWTTPSGGGGIVVIPLRYDEDTAMLASTATFEEIKTHLLSGKQVFFEDLTSQEEGETDILRYVVTVCSAKTESECIIDCMFYGGTTVIGMEFSTDSPNGYPAIED